jgi:hypothetical protein
MSQPLESDPARVEEQLRFVNIVCMALVVSVVLIAGVAGWIDTISDGSSVGPPLPLPIAIAASLVGLALLVAAPIVHRKMLATSRSIARTSERHVSALETYRLATLLGFILREGCAIVGLMTTLLTNQPGWCYGLSAAALVAMFTAWPRREELSGLLADAAAA